MRTKGLIDYYCDQDVVWSLVYGIPADLDTAVGFAAE